MIKYKRIIEEEGREFPPDHIWMNIEEQLDIDAVWENIHDQLDTEEVWNRIEMALDAENLKGSIITGIWKNQVLYRTVSAAAVILILLGTGFLLNRYLSQRTLSPSADYQAETKDVQSEKAEKIPNSHKIPVAENTAASDRLPANPVPPGGNERSGKENKKYVFTVSGTPDRASKNNNPATGYGVQQSFGSSLPVEPDYGIPVNRSYLVTIDPKVPGLLALNTETVSQGSHTLVAAAVPAGKNNEKKRPDWYAGITILGENNWILNAETFSGLQRNSLISTKPDFSAHYEFSAGVRMFPGWYLGTSLFLNDKVGQSYKTYIDGHYTAKNLTLKYSGINLFIKYSKRIFLTGYSNTHFNTYLGAYYHNLRAAEEQIGGSQVNRNREFRNADYGLLFGHELDIPAGKGYHFIPGIRLKYGLPNIYSGDGNIPSTFNLTHTATFEITLGVNFNPQRKF
ncbi:MAG: hypothetical protein GXO83_00465 [Chlorobi bacterium]|nr:hypothetical protein [Chlorobiota bacterium]